MSKKVLYIDDELELWEGKMRKQLSTFGFELKGELEPDNAIKCIRSYKPDVVLLDILFPGGNLGKAALGKIKEQYPSLPVVMITSTMDKDDFNAEEYAQADFRYSKMALTTGDYADLAQILNQAIEKCKNRTLQEGIEAQIALYGFVVGSSPEMASIVDTINIIATTDNALIVLITGESGTGKERVARAIHNLSKRKDKPFIPIVCAAMPGDLLESELFGHEKGAFTGAIAKNRGKFDIAEEGTIFLDEVAEISLKTQVKLLRFLQERTFESVGGQQTFTSKASILAATNRDLKKDIKQGTFREDLFFRLNVISIHLPPLRERKDDIPVLFEYFVKKANQQANKNKLTTLRPDVHLLFRNYSWPGNIREMENTIIRAVTLAQDTILQPTNFPELVSDNSNTTNEFLNIANIVDQIMEGNLKWDRLQSVKSTARRELLLALLISWEQKHHHRPTSKELAELLQTSYSNMRRLLSELNIKLSNI